VRVQAGDDLQLTTSLASLAGGVLVGLASAAILIAQGRVAGVSGICGSLLRPVAGDIAWRVGFVAGLFATGFVGARFWPAAYSLAGVPSMPALVVAGLLVGFGTRLGNGCTSGHGVCGVARLSRRSIVAALTFIGVAVVTVFVTRHVLGGGT
jgi:uncharacterized membrane protein YedE/YeeE